MNYKFLFLSALLISWSASLFAQGIAQTEFDLNKETPNCVNAKKLLITLDEDTNRLRTYSKSLTQGLDNVANIQKSLSEGCTNLAYSYRQGSFLEVTSTAFSTMATFQDQLKANLVTAGLSVDLRHGLGSTMEILAEISANRMTSTSEQARLQCEEGHSRLKSLGENLNNVLLSVNQNYLNTFVPHRREQIDKVLLECPITQTGLISKEYLHTGNEFEKRVPRARFQDYKIAFDKPFTEVPSVALSLAGFDMDTELPAVVALVQKVTENDFTLRVHLVPYARLYNIQVSYLATLPERSGIYPQLHIIDAAHDSDLANIAEQVGPRSVEKKVDIPFELQKEEHVGVVTYLSGFSFGEGADPRVKVSVSKVTPSDFTLRYSTSGSTRFLSAVTYNLIYKIGSDIQNHANEAAAEQNGNVLAGFGNRSEDVNLSLGNFKSKPEVFVGLYAFDFTKGYNYRIGQDVKVENVEKKSKLDLSFKSSGDSRVNMVKSSVFYSCHNKLC